MSGVAQTLSTRAYRRGDLRLSDRAGAADVVVSAEDHKVVQIAASLFAGDVERVSGKRPRVTNVVSPGIRTAVIIGTIGKSALIDSLVASRKIDVSQVRGYWESYIAATVKHPTAGVDEALVIAGSDRRGTAYGVFSVSELIGVSPWYWWADVTPEHRDEISLSPGRLVGHEPSVKYRGIFINDEDWGLQPWAAQTFEPETGDIGPKTYARVCELLLRLKANTLWPAMHEVTRAFNSFRENPRVADDYAIVMGSSHAEPVLRSNTTEWKDKPEAFNFVTNPAGVTAYWEDRVRSNAAYESIYTLGMRGIHDSAIQGPKTQTERIPLLEKIFGVQRQLLAKHIRPEVEQVPQIFCPYKEVLADYRAGLKVPEDVTVVFPDDNFGYLRQVPTTEEQKRRGGFGVYYHISYLGRPISYIWLESTPPGLIFEEMSKAWANNMRQLWIVNVGDIKPGEIGMEFFLRMAYDAGRWTPGNVDKYLVDWARREFGERHADEIAGLMNEYYRLASQRRPEHLQWYLPGEAPRPSDLTEGEKLDRLTRYARLRESAERLSERMAAAKRDAFFELVSYPVRSAAAANERYFAAEISRAHRSAGVPDAPEWARRSQKADDDIAADTRYFNETLAGSKWRHIMSPEMKPGQWTSMRATVPQITESDLAPVTVAARSVVPATSAVSGETITIEAENSNDRVDRSGSEWQVVKGLGRSEDSVTVFPNVARTFPDRTGPSVGYRFTVAESAEFTISFYLVPTQPLLPGNGLRFSFSVDGSPPEMVTIDRGVEVSSPKWSINVLNQITTGTAQRRLGKGPHTLRIIAVDTGVILDSIQIASGNSGAGNLGPEETRTRN